MNIKSWFHGAKELWYIYRPLVVLCLLLPVLFALCRMLFVAYKSAMVDGSYSYSELLLAGLRIDISSIGYLMIPLILIFTLAAFVSGHSLRLARYMRVGTGLLCALVLAVVIILESATPGFLDEYGVRPNRFFVEYLKYPKEVTDLLLRGHLGEVICSISFFIMALVLFGFLFVRTSGMGRKAGWVLLLTAFLFGEAAAVLAARSSLGHRPLNPAMVAFSTNPMTNEIALNSSYSLMYAISRMSSGKSAVDYYGGMPVEDIAEVLNSSSCRTPEELAIANRKSPTLSQNNAVVKRDRPLNIVILLEESFGAQFVKSLGGLDLAPNLDALSKEGWYFTDAYATGTRSIRGIEAVVSGFLPTPLPAIVKQDRAQRDFFTLPWLLEQHGYNTSFIYGGETHFDNMKSFFLANGVKTIIGQSDYENPVFVGSWGVSDEDLYNRANEFYKEASKSDKPFFSLVFSSSNHDPYEFPDGRIELSEQPKQTRNNAVKYEDYALGEFIRKAQKEDYWQNTLFLIIADHDSRVNGENLVPVKHFKIPALILGADVKPRIDDRIVSSIDMAPTLLSLAGIDAIYPMPGRDLNKSCDSGRAIMQYNQNFAYMWKNPDDDKHNVVIMTPQHEPQGFVLDHDNKNWEAAVWPQQKLKEAHAWAIAGDVFYKNDFFSVKPIKEANAK